MIEFEFLIEWIPETQMFRYSINKITPSLPRISFRSTVYSHKTARVKSKSCFISKSCFSPIVLRLDSSVRISCMKPWSTNSVLIGSQSSTTIWRITFRVLWRVFVVEARLRQVLVQKMFLGCFGL